MPSKTHVGPSRRTFLAGCIATVLGGCTAQSSPSKTTGSDARTSTDSSASWKQFAGDAKNTGHASDVTLPSQITRDWEATFGVIRTSPIVGDETVYLGIDDGIVALDATTGDERWSYSTPGVPIGTPALAGETLVVTDGERAVPSGSPDSPSGYIRGLDSESGELRWRVRVVGGGFAPTVTETTAYVRTARGVRAVRIEDGRERWRVEGLPAFQSNVPVLVPDLAPAVGEKSVFVPNPSGVLAVDRETGSEQWRVTVGQVRSAPTYDDGVVYVSGIETGVRALTADEGNTAWTWEANGCWASPAVAADAVYVAADGDLVALRARSGEERWRYDVHGDVYSSPAVASNGVVVGSKGWSGAAIRTTDQHRSLWTLDGGGTRFSPAVTSERVYVAHENGSLAAVAGR